MFVMPWLPPLNITKQDRRERVEISTPGVGRMVKEGDREGVAKILLSVISTHCDSPQLLNVFRIQQCRYPSIMFSPAEENACSARWIDSWKVVLTFELVDHILRCNHYRSNLILSPNSWIIRARRKRKLRINLGKKNLTCNITVKMKPLWHFFQIVLQ